MVSAAFINSSKLYVAKLSANDLTLNSYTASWWTKALFILKLYFDRPQNVNN